MFFTQYTKSFGIYTFAAAVIGLSSCEKEKSMTVNPATPTISTGSKAEPSTGQNLGNDKVIYEGEFKSYAHHTAGKAQITEDSNGKMHLVLRDFEYETGPELHIYIAKDEKAAEYVDVSTDLNRGDAQYTLNTSIDFTAKPYVIVWCKPFSVNFGAAKLAKQ